MPSNKYRKIDGYLPRPQPRYIYASEKRSSGEVLVIKTSFCKSSYMNKLNHAVQQLYFWIFLAVVNVLRNRFVDSYSQTEWKDFIGKQIQKKQIFLETF